MVNYSHAQSFSSIQQREINVRVFALIDQYNKLCESLSEIPSSTIIDSLFSKHAKIYNDLELNNSRYYLDKGSYSNMLKKLCKIGYKHSTRIVTISSPKKVSKYYYKIDVFVNKSISKPQKGIEEIISDNNLIITIQFVYYSTLSKFQISKISFTDKKIAFKAIEPVKESESLKEKLKRSTVTLNNEIWYVIDDKSNIDLRETKFALKDKYLNWSINGIIEIGDEYYIFVDSSFDHQYIMKKARHFNRNFSQKFKVAQGEKVIWDKKVPYRDDNSSEMNNTENEKYSVKDNRSSVELDIGNLQSEIDKINNEIQKLEQEVIKKENNIKELKRKLDNMN